ncbi:hypothetical protein MMC29_005381 [Sticta canariensis]|nr:hypothetical protein [Sticta canariensis]
MSCLRRDDQTSNCSMHMNLSTNSSKHFLLEPSSPKSQKEYKVASGITKEKLNELERQQPHRQTNGHGSEMMRYLQDTNASEAFAVGYGDEFLAASGQRRSEISLLAQPLRFFDARESDRHGAFRPVQCRRYQRALPHVFRHMILAVRIDPTPISQQLIMLDKTRASAINTEAATLPWLWIC